MPHHTQGKEVNLIYPLNCECGDPEQTGVHHSIASGKKCQMVKYKETCGMGCGRVWDEQGDFDCPSAYHADEHIKKQLSNPSTSKGWEKQIGDALHKAKVKLLVIADISHYIRMLTSEAESRAREEERKKVKLVDVVLFEEGQRVERERITRVLNIERAKWIGIPDGDEALEEGLEAINK